MELVGANSMFPVRTAWKRSEIDTLLDIWQRDFVQRELREKTTFKSGIYRYIAGEMAQRGFLRDSHQCKVKIKNMKRLFYAAEANKISRRGFYHEQLRELLRYGGHQPTNSIGGDVTGFQHPPDTKDDFSDAEIESNEDLPETKPDLFHLTAQTNIAPVEEQKDGGQTPAAEISAASLSAAARHTARVSNMLRMSAPCSRHVLSRIHQRVKRTPRYPMLPPLAMPIPCVPPQPPPAPPPPPPTTVLGATEVERVIDLVTSRLLQFHAEFERRLLEFEDRRLRQWDEREQRRCQEQREYELRLIQMLTAPRIPMQQATSPGPTQPPGTSGSS